MKPLRAQKFTCFLIWPPKSNPLSPGYVHTLGCPSAALTAPSHPTTDPKGLAHKLGNITITILSPLQLQPNPLQFPSAPARSQPVHRDILLYSTPSNNHHDAELSAKPQQH